MPYNRTIIYECHVKGMTMRHPDVPPELRGTYLGLCSDPMIEYFQSLGVTALELLPVHQFVVDRHLAERGLTNYWGYNSIGFFAPDVRYATRGLGNQVYEFKTMVKTLHSAGLEVILDVVYNHTGEGNHLGPTLSLQGHRQLGVLPPRADNPRFYTDFTGTGNSLNMQHPRTIQLIMDSLRYWVNEMHVDGFRFDLAPVLARELYDVDKLSAFFDIMQQDPDARRREAHRRAVGRRARAAIRSATFPCAGRSGTASIATRCASSGGASRDRCRRWRVALAGSSDIFSSERPRRVREHQLHHRARRLHAARPRELRAEAQRGERREQPGRPQRQHQPQLGRRRARRTIRRSSTCAIALMRTFLATLAFSQGVPMLVARRRDRRARSAATTTRTRRTTRSPG